MVKSTVKKRHQTAAERKNDRRRWMEGAAGAAAGASGSAVIASTIGLSMAANVAAPIIGTVVGAIAAPLLVASFTKDRPRSKEQTKG
jgi:uncharacterized membrane protein